MNLVGVIIFLCVCDSKTSFFLRLCMEMVKLGLSYCFFFALMRGKLLLLCLDWLEIHHVFWGFGDKTRQVRSAFQAKVECISSAWHSSGQGRCFKKVPPSLLELHWQTCTIEETYQSCNVKTSQWVSAIWYHQKAKEDGCS